MLTVTWAFRPQVYDTVRHAGRLTLYEGLPHPTYEHEAFQEELKAKPTVQLSSFPFYREPLNLDAEDVESLRGLLGARSTYEARAGDYGDLIVEKSCGGFHPDYAVEWSSGGKVYRCLICFGCSEVRIEGPPGEWSFYDLRSEGHGRDRRMRLLDLLKTYRKDRPPHERFGTGPLAVMSRLCAPW